MNIKILFNYSGENYNKKLSQNFIKKYKIQ